MGPAQRAVAGVQEQVGDGRASDQRHIAGRGGAQAAPELGAPGIAGAGEQLLHAPHDGLATHGVQVAVVAVELGRARNAQAVALRARVAREHQLELVVREADLIGLGGVQHRQGHGVALGRIDGQAQPQRLGQQRAERAHGQHIGVALDAFIAALGIGHLHMVDMAAGARASGAQRRHVVALAELHARGGGDACQLAREEVGVARFILGRIGGARYLPAHMGQGRLQAHGFVGIDQAAVAAQGLHLLGGLERALELAGVRIEVQDALHALLVLDAGVRPQLLQGLAAVGAQAHDLLDVVARARGRAVAQEGQAPEPLAHVGAQAEQQGGVLPAQPAQQLQRCAGVGPGLGMADRDLPAVGEAGFGAGRGLAVDDGHFMTEGLQIVGRRGADQTGSENDDAHDDALSKACAGSRESWPLWSG